MEGVGAEVYGGTVEASVSREGGVQLPLTQVIERQLSVGKEEVPKIRGKVDMQGGEDGREVVLERANCPLRGIRTVVLGRNMLDNGTGGERMKEGGEGG
jgi:hypothetical protein